MKNQDWSGNIFFRAVLDGSGLQRSGSRKSKILGGNFRWEPLLNRLGGEKQP
jgi:hypothetical protein